MEEGHLKESDEIELKDFVNSVRKRKWLVAGLTLAASLVAAAVIFLRPLRWEVEAFCLFNLPQELEVDSRQLAGLINQASADRSLPGILKMEGRSFPTVRVEVFRPPHQVRVTIFDKDVKKAKNILKTMVGRLNWRINEKLKKKEAEKVEYIQLIKVADSSRPYFLPAKLILPLTAILAFLFSTLFAYFLGCLQKRKSQ